ncbi:MULTISPECIES: hypothetical protein [Xanthomonas]|nr:MULTISPECIES: hypothetical protein [Xanthomonas]MBV6794046.1 hypothetical protein [Xanthomonas campestris pv. daturae]QTK49025.1 hypothetical protein XeaCFBP3836p_07755 [Xanthomonas euvesicatoria pv. alfalfae]WDK24321.1 hypothetical protein JH274_13310 [Xanthomonas campestris pv. incanae]
MNCKKSDETMIDADKMDLELIADSVEPPSRFFMGGIFSDGGWIIAVEEE